MCENNHLDPNTNLITTPHTLFNHIVHPLPPSDKPDLIVMDHSTTTFKDFPGKILLSNTFNINRTQKLKKKVSSKLFGRTEGGVRGEKKEIKGGRTQHSRDAGVQENMVMANIRREDSHM